MGNKKSERYKKFLETLTLGTLENLKYYVSKDVRYKDPLNDTQGIDDMRKVFNHMFLNVKDIKFVVNYFSNINKTCLMQWRFSGELRGKNWEFDGTSMITFSSDGYVIEHIEYWDISRDLYEHFPVIGRILSFMRRCLSAHHYNFQSVFFK